MNPNVDIRLACVEDGLDNTGFRKIAAFIKSINKNTKVAYVPTANWRNLVGVLMERKGGNLQSNDITKVAEFNHVILIKGRSYFRQAALNIFSSTPPCVKTTLSTNIFSISL